MTDRERKTVLHALASAQAGIDLALSLLMGEQQNQPCQHPAEKRQDLRGMSGGPEHYYCTACRAEVDRHGEEARPTGEDAEEVPDPDGPELPD